MIDLFPPDSTSKYIFSPYNDTYNDTHVHLAVLYCVENHGNCLGYFCLEVINFHIQQRQSLEN